MFLIEVIKHFLKFHSGLLVPLSPALVPSYPTNHCLCPGLLAVEIRYFYLNPFARLSDGEQQVVMEGLLMCRALLGKKAAQCLSSGSIEAGERERRAEPC